MSNPFQKLVDWCYDEEVGEWVKEWIPCSTVNTTLGKFFYILHFACLYSEGFLKASLQNIYAVCRWLYWRNERMVLVVRYWWSLVNIGGENAQSDQNENDENARSESPAAAKWLQWLPPAPSRPNQYKMQFQFLCYLKSQILLCNSAMFFFIFLCEIWKVVHNCAPQNLSRPAPNTIFVVQYNFLLLETN